LVLKKIGFFALFIAKNSLFGFLPKKTYQQFFSLFDLQQSFSIVKTLKFGVFYCFCFKKCLEMLND